VARGAPWKQWRWALILLPLLLLTPGRVLLNHYSVEDGERLLHGDSTVALAGWETPIVPILVAAADGHLSKTPRAFLIAAFLISCILLCAALGCRLHSLGAGVAASLGAALYLRWAPAVYLLDLGLVVHAATFLSAVLLWCDDSLPPRTRWHGLGAIIGVSLWVRSPLVLLPLGILIVEYQQSRQRLPRFLQERWPLLAWPILMLLPWTLLHLSQTGEWVFLEKGRLDSNTLTGAMGLVGTIEGDARKLAGLTEDASARWWAIQEVLAHPLRYLGALARRFAFVARLHPVVLGLGIAACWTLRRDKKLLRLSLCALYFLGLHVLLTVEDRYFPPLWLLLITAVAVFLTGLRWPQRPAIPLSRGLAAGAVVPLVAAWFVATGLTLRLAFAAPLNYENASAKAPKDPWLRQQAGKSRLERGETTYALNDFQAAYRAHPGWGRGFDLALAHIAIGNSATARIDGRTLEDYLSDPAAEYPGRLILTLLHLSRNETASATRAYAEAGVLWRQRGALLRVVETDYDRAVLKRLRSIDTGLRERFDGLFHRLPYPQRLQLAQQVPKIGLKNQALLETLLQRLPKRT
jgi:hypothetical protein